MNKKLLLLLLLFISAKSVLSQEYINEVVVIDPLLDNTNCFGLEYFYTDDRKFMGYKKDGIVVIPAQYAYTQGFCKKGIARVSVESP